MKLRIYKKLWTNEKPIQTNILSIKFNPTSAKPKEMVIVLVTGYLALKNLIYVPNFTL